MSPYKPSDHGNDLVPVRPLTSVARSGDYIDSQPVAHEDLTAAGLLDYWKILLNRKWTVVSLTAAGMMLGFMAAIPTPLLFDAKTTIEIQDFNPNFMGMAQLDPRAGNYSPTELNIATELHILQSNVLKSRVLEKLNRELTPMNPPEVSGVLARTRRRAQELLGSTPQDPLVAMRRALGKASGTLNLQGVRGTRLIEIRSQSTIPDVAAAFANAMATEYIEQSLEERMKSLQRASQWFSTQLQEVKEKLERSQDRLRTLKVAGNAASTDVQADSLTAARLTGLQQHLATAQAERIAKEAQYQMVLKSTNAESALDTTALGPYRSKVEELRRTLTGLNASFTPAHYKVKQAEAELADAEAALAHEREALVTRLRTDVETLKSRERLLLGAYNGQAQARSPHSDQALQYSLLQNEVETNRQQYQLLLQQVNQANVAAAVPANNIRVVEAAMPSRQPSNLFQSKTTMLGGVTGLLLSFALAVVMHHLNRSMTGPGHATNLLQVRELGVVPSGYSKIVRDNGNHTGGLLRFTRPVDPSSVELVAWDKPSMLADSFRSILASILIPHRSQVPQVIVMSSPNVKEGKSTLTSNLGIALTELNRRVLLIDADLRRPRLHRIFELDNSTGLASMLTSDRNVADYTSDEIGVPTKVKGLRVLTSGPAAESVNALLYSPRFQALLASLRGKFDNILIDTPPLLQFSDARVLGKISDGVVLVLRSGVTDQSSAIAARNLLAEDGSRLIGTILNDWMPSAKEARYYEQYQSYYSRTAD
jgi:polysaccharide biosynthesis transport protein